MNEKKEALIECYIARSAIASGVFTLASGATSNLYIDGRMVTTFPKALRLIADSFKSIIERENLLPEDGNLVVPGGIGGIPIGTALALAMDIPMVIDRGVQKAHGLAKRFEGSFSQSKHCLLVDDLVTVGGTLLKTVDGLRDLGYTVSDALVVVDREEGGAEDLERHGIKIHSLLTKAELRQALLAR